MSFIYVLLVSLIFSEIVWSFTFTSKLGTSTHSNVLKLNNHDCILQHYRGSSLFRYNGLKATRINTEVSAITSPLKIIIAGAPAAGKGTQCEYIKQDFGVVHLSTGDILRAAVKDGTELGLKAKGFMDAGQLVPDELITGVICDRLQQPDCLSNGWLLDGFPRTKAQASALASAGIIPDCFVLLDVNEDVLVERVTGRRTDPVTGKIYHMTFSPPETEEIAARLVQRSDDTEEKIVVRYREFQSHINEVRSSYEDKMIWVDGTQKKETIRKVLVASLKSKLDAKLHEVVGVSSVGHPSAVPHSVDTSPLKIIIAGAPAAGKGTQCEYIKQDFGVVHLSTGDILRAAVKDGTELGLKAKGFMDAGQLVPDELITGVICDRLQQPDCLSNGWLLDGFPRTKAQASALATAGIIPDCFVLLDVNEDVLVERVTGRRTDPVSGKIYHMTFSPPETEEIAARLVQRSDDTEEKIVVRYREFQSHINEVRSSYEDKMIWVDGTQKKETIRKVLVASLKSKLDFKAGTQCAGSMLVEPVSESNLSSLSTSTSKIRSSNDLRLHMIGGRSKHKRRRTSLRMVEHDSNLENSRALSDNISSMSSDSSSAVNTITGLALLIYFDHYLRSLFVSLKIGFPSSLAGMMITFASLTALDSLMPSTTQSLFYKLSYSVSFIKTWLVCFFVAPLIALPLKLQLIKGYEGRLLGTTLLGAVASLASTGLFAKYLSQINSKMEEQSNRNASNRNTPPSVTPSAPATKLPTLTWPLVISAASLVATSIRPLPSSLRSQARTVFEVSSVASGYIFGSTKVSAGIKKIVHPVIICALYSLLSLSALASTLQTPLQVILMEFYSDMVKSGHTQTGQLISSLLGPSIISFGLQLYQYRQVLKQSAPLFLLTTGFSSIFGLLSSALLSRLAKFNPTSLSLSPLTRCITSPLAQAGAVLTGADKSITVFFVVLTGIVGASIGETLLKSLSVDDPICVGLSMGASAHGIGTAAIATNPVAFASSVVSMTLTGLWTVVLLSQEPIRSRLIKFVIA